MSSLRCCRLAVCANAKDRLHYRTRLLVALNQFSIYTPAGVETYLMADARRPRDDAGLNMRVNKPSRSARSATAKAKHGQVSNRPLRDRHKRVFCTE